MGQACTTLGAHACTLDVLENDDRGPKSVGEGKRRFVSEMLEVGVRRGKENERLRPELIINK